MTPTRGRIPLFDRTCSAAASMRTFSSLATSLLLLQPRLEPRPDSTGLHTLDFHLLGPPARPPRHAHLLLPEPQRLGDQLAHRPVGAAVFGRRRALELERAVLQPRADRV